MKPWWWYKFLHRVTCWRCYPGILTGMQRRQGGKGFTTWAVASLAIWAVIFLIAYLLGTILKGD